MGNRVGVKGGCSEQYCMHVGVCMHCGRIVCMMHRGNIDLLKVQCVC